MRCRWWLLVTWLLLTFVFFTLLPCVCVCVCVCVVAQTLHNIMSHLRAPDLIRCRLVCRDWAVAATHDDLWRAVYSRRWGRKVVCYHGPDYKVRTSVTHLVTPVCQDTGGVEQAACYPFVAAWM